MKTFLLLLTITSGILFPYGHEYTFLIRYFLMILLFFSFLDIKINRKIVTKKHFVILATMITAAVSVYLIISLFNSTLAQTAFITAIAPTAIAAPVIISLKKKKVEFTAVSLIINNFSIALMLPFLLPLIVNSQSNISVSDILFPVMITFSIPLLAAQLVKFVLPKFWKFLIDWKDSSFYILVLNIYIATSDATNYVRTNLMSDLSIVFLIAFVSITLCVFFFSLGWIIGKKDYAHEASQSLGQKNNAFSIWISLTFMNPITVLGPVFYVLFQNIYISWELYIHNRELKLQKS